MTRLTLEYHLRAIRDGTTDEAYSTGFPLDGRVCTAYDVPASKALRSPDVVRYLDAVAQDPHRHYQERTDAASLLNHHIWPDNPDAGTLGRSESLLGHTDRPDINFSEWNTRRARNTYSPAFCERCEEGECLSDPDCHRTLGIAVCMSCGLIQPVPDYP